MKTRRDIIRKEAAKYQRERKKGKGTILDQIVNLIGYNRIYAGWLMRNYGKRRGITIGGKRVIMVAGFCKMHRRRERIYDESVLKVLKKIWAIMDFACGKRLAPYLREIIEKLEQKKELCLDEGVKEKLLTISSATIDRLLKKEKKGMKIKAGGHTKPGSMLKSQIPIRTFSEWDEKKPGFIEVDLVAHDGGKAHGDFNHSLNCTDIATGWTDPIAIRNKAQIWTFEALQKVEHLFPFHLLGIDSDNGSEFINSHLLQYCKQKRISFTRSRPYRKNDNCYVEQKNWTVIRRTVGYTRYDTDESVKLLNKLYEFYRLYNNFFQPNMKLVEKTRIGSKVKKRYDKPKTPYQRVLQSPYVEEKIKKELQVIYENLNPVELLKQIEKIKSSLAKLQSCCNNDILSEEKNIANKKLCLKK